MRNIVNVMQRPRLGVLKRNGGDGALAAADWKQQQVVQTRRMYAHNTDHSYMAKKKVIMTLNENERVYLLFFNSFLTHRNNFLANFAWYFFSFHAFFVQYSRAFAYWEILLKKQKQFSAIFFFLYAVFHFRWKHCCVLRDYGFTYCRSSAKVRIQKSS